MRLFVMLLLVTTLVGCSANRLLYNRADTFIRWAADDYVTLTASNERFDQRLDVFWLGIGELPRYREFIVTSLDTLEDGVTLEEAVQYRNRPRSRSISGAIYRAAFSRQRIFQMSRSGLFEGLNVTRPSTQTSVSFVTRRRITPTQQNDDRLGEALNRAAQSRSTFGDSGT